MARFMCGSSRAGCGRLERDLAQAIGRHQLQQPVQAAAKVVLNQLGGVHAAQDKRIQQIGDLLGPHADGQAGLLAAADQLV